MRPLLRFSRSLTNLFLVSLALLVAGSVTAAAQQLILTQTHPAGIYAPGEVFRVQVTAPAGTDSIRVTIRENFHGDEAVEMIPYSGSGQVIFEGAYDMPTAVTFHVRAGDLWAATGTVVDPGGFEPGMERPKDFNRFWNQEKKALRALPMEIKTTPVPDIENGFVCYDTEINTTGPAPARGYFAKPENAQKGTLPIVLVVHAAGVKGSWCLSKPENALRYAKMGKGALCFDLNAHGMLNGQPQEYYDALEEGSLKGYYFQGVEARDDYYFRGMYLRLIRTLDYLADMPEWDGERIIVIGESQGGGQALAAAGLDKRVTAAVAIVPAMCDWGGPLAGRKGGWPNPLGAGFEKQKVLDAVPYFDAAHLLKHARATLLVEIGFIDVTCPPPSIYAAVNQAKGEKVILTTTYRGHQLEQDSFRKNWEEQVYGPRIRFIESFLE